MRSTLPAAVAEHIAAVNANDTDRIMATFNTDALVNDARREFWGSERIRQWVAREIVGDRVTMQAVQVLVHHGLDALIILHNQTVDGTEAVAHPETTA